MCKDLENWIMRVQLLHHATKLCPKNCLLWRDLVRLMSSSTLDQEKIQNWLSEEIAKLSETSELSKFAKIESSVPKQMKNLIDGTESEWYCRDKEGKDKSKIKVAPKSVKASLKRIIHIIALQYSCQSLLKKLIG